ncbi:hypothetical protein BGZ65_011575, partial [Modicella reniformis]
MRIAQLYSIPLTAALVAQALPQVLAAEPKIPLGGGQSAFAFVENQGLYISDGIRYDPEIHSFPYKRFISLDLSTAWESDAPAWNSLPYDESNKEYGNMLITKDGDTLIFVSNKTTLHNYDIKSNQWGQAYSMNWTDFPFRGGVVTDLDTGLIYGIDTINGRPPMESTDPEAPWVFTEFNPVNKSFTKMEMKGRPGSTIW